MGRLPESPLSLYGGCLCGAVRYTIEVPELQDRPQAEDAMQGGGGSSDDDYPRMPLVSWCHCTSCRVGSGGLVASWLGTPQAWVSFTTQEAKGTTRQQAIRDILLGANVVDQKTTIGVYCHTKGNFRTFCKRCGSSLTFSEEGGETFRGMGPLIDVATGTLDNESLELVRADRHTWWSDGRGWIKDLFRTGDEASLKHEKGTMSKVME
ncbi:Mss4-like protein [Elsinoe ampelina]|uniref:Mss4-like protein n=1 Tax=Elsinoe ampelina TaxID=302913 RepID=A0A6A6G7S8_9PEZI|nr:Mss4-like protein [Elsinoe ampelina]